jgi:hypothetical protein
VEIVLQDIQKEIEAIEQELRDIVASVEIIGELDFDGTLILSEKETLPEAVERKEKMDNLMERKRELEESSVRKLATNKKLA